jgi:enoyl-[acyl-carrier-protein] reductase (NADH)
MRHCWNVFPYEKVGLVVGIARKQLIACSDPLHARVESGIVYFDGLLDIVAGRTATHQPSTIEDVGAHAVFPSSDAARNVTGGVHHIEGGCSITG